MQTRRTALVTGGSRGIGHGIATALAREGFDLAINGVRPAEQVGEALDSLRALGARVVYCPGSVASPEERQAVWDRALAELGAIDVLVNNAGIAPKVRADLLETSLGSYRELLQTNVEGAFFLSQQAARHLVARRQADPACRGCIINVSSISATVVSVNRGEYCVAKAALSMVTQLFAARLGEYDIPVYEVRPGVTKTDMTAGVAAKYDKLLAEGLCPQRRWGLPEDVGRAVAALARGDFPYSTGQVILIDGGLTIPRL